MITTMKTTRAAKLAFAVLLVSFASAIECQAGMPSITLRDIYRLRFQELSFFIFLLLVCSLLFKVMWNYAAKGFSWLPRLNFRRALCLASLFGLVMLLILTMISGIREVLTPGAWRKQGSTYRL